MAKLFWRPNQKPIARARMAGRVFLTTLLLELCAFAAFGAATLSAVLDRNTISLGETATLTLTARGGSPASPPVPPLVANLTISYSGQGSELTIINGARDSKVNFTYLVQPRQPGDYTIPAMQAAIGNQVVVSQPLQLKVTKAGTVSPAPGAPFVKLVPSKTGVYVGEVLPFEVQLYAQQGEQVQLAPVPCDGFTLNKSTDRPQISQTIYNNQRYSLGLYKFIATPAKAGALTLGPATVSMVVPDYSRRDFFGSIGGKQITLVSEPQTIQALPLPAANVPADFSGAIGNYTLNVTAGPTNVAVGDPITVNITITGRGVLESLSLPPQPQWREFKTYPPNSRIESSDPQGITGAKIFEQVVIPQNHEVTALPGVTLSFFDPEQRKYRTLASRPVPLVVRPSATSVAPAAIATNAATGANAAAAGENILRIKPHLGAFVTPAAPWVTRPWFWALQAVPLMTWLGMLTWRRRIDALANNPRLRRRRETERLVTGSLRDLRRLATGNQREEFFAAVFRVLQWQIGDLLDLPASSITEAVIEERLRPQGVPGPALGVLHDLFQTCNQARYAPESTPATLAALLPKVESVVTELRRARA